MIVISDIDGTLADVSARMKRAGKPPKKHRGKAFQKWLDTLQNNKILLDDSAIDCMKELLLALHARKHKIIYLTGRSCKYRRVTSKWLKLHGFPTGPLLMRGRNSHTKAATLKREKMLKIAKKAGGEKILVLDDDGDNSCTNMYRKYGWTHLKPTVNADCTY